MTATTATLSAQENAIHEGKKVLHGTVTDRVLRMFEGMRATARRALRWNARSSSPRRSRRLQAIRSS